MSQVAIHPVIPSSLTYKISYSYINLHVLVAAKLIPHTGYAYPHRFLYVRLSSFSINCYMLGKVYNFVSFKSSCNSQISHDTV